MLLTPGTTEGTNLANSSRNAVELATDCGRPRFRSKHTKAVTGTYQVDDVS